ncbi:hypothetical protein JTB14_011012 [Gonioctena quinquepunctata]|nr:hypothetical protein JTB14_011012 [Gonioctena quinquepunctata]
MCSIGDDVFDSEPKKLMLPEKSIMATTCNKCRKEKPCIVLRSKDSYCKGCFLAGTTHKFKALLGKSRLIRPKEKVLVYHKIGHPSTALLHFLRTGLDLNTPKKLRFDPVILFIDDQYHLTLKERQTLLKAAVIEIKSFGFSVNLISFAGYLSNPTRVKEIIVNDSLDISENDKDKASVLINKKCTNTSRNDIKPLLQKQLLLDVARCLECKFIFTPEISVDTASQLLTNISLGRGSNIPIDTGFCDNRDEEIYILRPLRLYDMKELAFYNQINNLEPLSVRQQQINPYSSVQELMKKFVNDLQANFPATVTTILKTGDKLTMEKDSPIKCRICKGVLLKTTPHLTSKSSTDFSHLVSTEIFDNKLTSQERYQNVLEKFDNEIFEKNELCYACSKISDYFFEMQE